MSAISLRVSTRSATSSRSRICCTGWLPVAAETITVLRPLVFLIQCSDPMGILLVQFVQRGYAGIFTSTEPFPA